MKFREDYKMIFTMNPDIVVIPECENINRKPFIDVVYIRKWFRKPFIDIITTITWFRKPIIDILTTITWFRKPFIDIITTMICYIN